MKSALKWIIITCTALGVHLVFFSLSSPESAEKEVVNTVEIKVELRQDEGTMDPNPSLAELERRRLEQVRLAAERRKEAERLAELKRLEQERLAEKARVAEEKVLAEQKKGEAIAAQKEQEKRKQEQAAKEAYRKRMADELAAKKATEALARKNRLEAQQRNEEERKKQAHAEATRQAALAKNKEQELANKKTQRALRLTKQRPPSYPSSLRRKGVEGRVQVTVQISSTGKVTSATVSSSSGHSEFDQSALKAAQKWKYRPAYNGLGQAMSDTKTETIYYKLQ